MMINLTRRDVLKSLLAALAVPVASHSAWALADNSLPHLPDHLYFLRPQDAAFAAHKQIFNRRITLVPRLIAVCLTAKGIQTAMQYAAAKGLPVSVKSGGHSFEGFSLNQDGLLLDLSLMRAITYNPSTKSMLVEPGAKLGDVYAYLAKFGRMIPAGSCGGVGVAGLTLGGGYGFFSRRLGLTCDSLTEVQLVDGKGKLHGSKNNPELLWACKGGNNGNFGIVTALRFNTHAAPQTFTHYRFKFRGLDTKKMLVLAERWFLSMQTLPDTCYSSWVLGPAHLTVLVTDTAPKATAPLQAILKRLAVDATEVQPARQDAFLRGIQRFRGGLEPMYFKNVSTGYYKSFADIKGVLATIHPLMAKSNLKTNLLQINTLGGAIQTGVDPKTAAYPHRQYAFLGEFQVYYDRASQTPAAETLVNQVQHKFTQAGIKAHYCNYPDVGIKDWQHAYYAESYPRLQALKRTLDPQNLIRHPQSVRG